MYNLPNIIGITGRKRHGKDTLGDYLVKNYGYIKIGFADALKEACKNIFGFNYEQLYGTLKEADDEYWKTSPRKILQFVGTDLFRDKISEILPDVKQDIWIKVVEKQILDNPQNKYVITDVRFENELEFITKHNGLKIKVQRDLLNNNDTHLSESFIDNLNTDFTIKNNGTLDELYQILNDIILYNKHTKINNFNNIKILNENTLYVFDIDETLMVYENLDKNWWNNMKKDNDEIKVLEEWEKCIKNKEPKHTHNDSFQTLLNNINKNNIICLTARQDKIKDLTEKHLEQIGITNIPVYYTNGFCKGKLLQEIIKDYKDIKNIIFVDDLIKNLYSVNKVFHNTDYNVNCYHFNYNK